jgi:hypothetical protein
MFQFLKSVRKSEWVTNEANAKVRLAFPPAWALCYRILIIRSSTKIETAIIHARHVLSEWCQTPTLGQAERSCLCTIFPVHSSHMAFPHVHGLGLVYCFHHRRRGGNNAQDPCRHRVGEEHRCRGGRSRRWTFLLLLLNQGEVAIRELGLLRTAKQLVQHQRDAIRHPLRLDGRRQNQD